MDRAARVFLRCSFVVLLLVTGLGIAPGARAEERSPATSADAVRSALVTAQGAILRGDQPAATASIDGAAKSAEPIIAAFGGQSAAGQRLAAGLDDARAAVANGDASGLAFARAEVWTAILAGAYERTLSAIASGDIATARAWLLVREFRASTKFSRPGADATLALRDLEQGVITPDAAIAAVKADLLDTYQANFDAALLAAGDALTSRIDARSAEYAGTIAGYWLMLAPSYEEQFGAEQRASIDMTVGALTTALASGDLAAAQSALPTVAGSLELFRAAPLSEEEQARRAGQLLLYLSLIPVEYGRGVKNGQVTSDIEIQEAQSFHDGAQAAFNDLRLPLNAQDPVKTAEVAAILTTLQTEIHAAARHESVADASTISDAAGQATATLKSLFPEEWVRPGGDADFDVIASLLDEMEKAIAARQYAQAESARLEAYAIYEVGPEKRLMGFAPGLAQKVEALFWQGNGETLGLSTLIATSATSTEIRATRLALDKALRDSQNRLGAGRPADGAIIFNAATIVFREGLEAVLILVSLMASMVGANQRFKKPLAIGAIGALIASAALFVLAKSLLASLGRYGEKLEAVVSLVAIGVLLLVMNWFFHKVYWTKWIAGHHARRRAILGGAAGQMIGLVALGVTSVFREGGETVLFLQALVLDAGTAVVIEGVLLGMAAVGVVGVLVFAMQKKLPHKKMLIVTGIMIAAVLVVMVGNTIHVFQVVGWAPITPIGTTQFPYWTGVWFGLFSTWEGVIAQAVAFVFVIGSYYLAEFQHGRSLAKLAASAPPVTSPTALQS
ncbi:MAG: iron permease [Thermomicrobiales bacterium]|nr:iron permease [Thermomicrobiales bacterium]